MEVTGHSGPHGPGSGWAGGTDRAVRQGGYHAPCCRPGHVHLCGQLEVADAGQGVGGEIGPGEIRSLREELLSSGIRYMR